MRYSVRSVVLFLLALVAAPAHIGVKDVFFEGLAGPYPLSVVIRPPSVIPGMAEISIRSAAKDVKKIRLTTMMLSGPGSKYPPTPDDAMRSSVDAQTFGGSLWLMVSGSWQVKVLVEGDRGSAALSVPVAAASERVTEMDGSMGGMLLALCLLLVVGVVGIAGAAFTEATVPPGERPVASKGRLWAIRGTSLAVCLGILWLGWQWWGGEARAYSESIYKPLGLQAVVEGSTLKLRLNHAGWYQSPKLDDFIEDHGHLMHLFLVRAAGGDAMIHLHPELSRRGEFAANVSAVPAGRYQVFADVVHKSGFAETLRTEVAIASSGTAAFAGDDSSWLSGQPASLEKPFRIAEDRQVSLKVAGDLKPGNPIQLRFLIHDGHQNGAKDLKPYMGMAGHLVLYKQDFGVFAHLHPAGTVSMSALELAQGGLEDTKQRTSHAMVPSSDGEIVFPFGFPTAGNYRLILQFRDQKQIHSAPFDLVVK